MDIFTALHTRRSIRKFTDEPVSEEHLNILLDAAMIAPSAGNSQPWRFVVVDDKKLLKQVPAINKYALMAPDSPLGILVCGDLKAEKHPGFWVQDCSAATQNILLAAAGLGLGTVWTGIYPNEERVNGFSNLFKLPAHIQPLALILAGHHTNAPERKSRFDAAKVHRNAW